MALARYDYEPQRDDEIRLQKGATISVLVKSSDGWWKGEVCFFYVKKIFQLHFFICLFHKNELFFI